MSQERNGSSPLHHVPEDDDLIIMENMLPYCEPALGRALALTIKLREIQKIFRDIHSDSYDAYLQACGVTNTPDDMETMLQSLKNTLSQDRAAQIDQMLQMMQLMKTFQKFQRLSEENPEIFSMMQSLTQGGAEGMDQPKKILELLSAAQSNGKEVQDLLSILLHAH